MIVRHWEEVERDRDAVALAVDWDSYRRYERDGVFRAISLRCGDVLIGYNAFFVHRSLHFHNLTSALCDVLYVEPERRGLGGLRLLKESELLLRQIANPIRIIYHSKPYVHIGAKSGTLGQLLQYLGYRHDEDVFTKLVRGT